MAFPSTFLDLQQDVIEKSRLDTTDDTPRVKDWLNNSYYEVCLETNFFESVSATVPLAANAVSVAVPTSIIKIEYISPAGSDGMLWGPMAQVTLEEILELRAWQGGVVRTGAPSRFAFRSSGSPTIEFYPQANGGEVLTFYGVALPAIMVNDTDQPIIPDPYRMVISYGALIDASEFKKDLLMIQQFTQGYEQLLQQFRGFNNVRVGSKVQQFRVEGRRPIPQRNDIDSGY